jgi:hypothetical protein
MRSDLSLYTQSKPVCTDLFYPVDFFTLKTVRKQIIQLSILQVPTVSSFSYLPYHMLYFERC